MNESFSTENSPELADRRKRRVKLIVLAGVAYLGLVIGALI